MLQRQDLSGNDALWHAVTVTCISVSISACDQLHKSNQIQSNVTNVDGHNDARLHENKIYTAMPGPNDDFAQGYDDRFRTLP